MIAMPFFDVTCCGDEVVAEYAPAKVFNGMALDASVWLRLHDRGARIPGGLNLSIESVRGLAEQLPQILMLHDAAERLAAEKTVA